MQMEYFVQHVYKKKVKIIVFFGKSWGQDLTYLSMAQYVLAISFKL